MPNNQVFQSQQAETPDLTPTDPSTIPVAPMDPTSDPSLAQDANTPAIAPESVIDQPPVTKDLPDPVVTKDAYGNTVSTVTSFTN